MAGKKKSLKKVKEAFHTRNRFRGRYDFDSLITSYPELKSFVRPNKYGDLSIDFFDPSAVKALNAALLRHHYRLDYWDIPDGYLCPPIPGRAEYIHHVADLLAEINKQKPPKGYDIRCLDIGAGANYIYPIIGIKEYQWSFVSTEIDKAAIASIDQIIRRNPSLLKNSEVRLQEYPKYIFQDVIKGTELFDLCICNPPFHSSQEEAHAATFRKLKGISQSKDVAVIRNFGGQHNELWCEGGEERFIQTMISESQDYRTSIYWFTTLVSKQGNLEGLEMALQKAQAAKVKVIPMQYGNKSTRILAWTYLSPKQEKVWVSARW